MAEKANLTKDDTILIALSKAQMVLNKLEKMYPLLLASMLDMSDSYILSKKLALHIPHQVFSDLVAEKDEVKIIKILEKGLGTAIEAIKTEQETAVRKHLEDKELTEDEQAFIDLGGL